MRYEAQVTRLSAPDMALKERTLREECLQFALVYGYAKQFDAPLTFLDESFDLSRFRTLELRKSKSYILNPKPLGTWGVRVDVLETLKRVEASVKRQWIVDAVEINCVSSYPSTTLQFIGPVFSSCCKYMLLLIAGQSYVLNLFCLTKTGK
ncbi:hypothetical protein V6N12_041744 [Hibiscus sabdariffa]|uniref:Uncharacterized protein n=1 Tax=Hibiscus sabdariffa TaxID=183260 RepID=A0ABR2B3K3_9ROSI